MEVTVDHDMVEPFKYQTTQSVLTSHGPNNKDSG